MSLDDDDLYGDLEGDDGGLDLYGGLVEEVKKPAEKLTKASPPPEKEAVNPAPVQQQHTSSITNSGKIFVGGLNWNTNEDTLEKYFSKYGDIVDSVIMRDNLSQKSRGFGFITFADGKIVDGVLSLQHTIDGKIVDPKRAVPKSDTEKTEKIFVGGLQAEVSEAEFREYFSQFGGVIDAIIMNDRETGRPRGFGFITFENSECVDRVLDRQGSLNIRGKSIEVKRAQPKGAPGLAPPVRPPIRAAANPAMMMMPYYQMPAAAPQVHDYQNGQGVAYGAYYNPAMAAGYGMPLQPPYGYYQNAPQGPAARGGNERDDRGSRSRYQPYKR